MANKKLLESTSEYMETSLPHSKNDHFTWSMCAAFSALRSSI